MGKKILKVILAILKAIVTLVLSAAALVLVLGILCWGVLNMGVPNNTSQSEAKDLAVMDRYDMLMTNQISSALDGVLAIEKVYWLNDDDQIAPEPDPEKFGTANSASELQWLLDEAADLLDGQETLFSTDISIEPGTQIHYYLDETILTITWRQIIDNAVYTISEVKIGHPSQFRRFLADGQYGSDKQYLTTQMAATVNAVTASSGDFYKFRPYGIIVYNGEVKRVNTGVDTCFIDDQGDLIFSRQGELKTIEEAQQFVDENNIRFSLAFGPILVDNYQKVVTRGYPIGEINNKYSRAAIATMGELHYLMVAVNHGTGMNNVPTISLFADQMIKFGVEKAYALDGGQTAAIVTGDKLISRPDWGTQRLISDIIYFASAVPNGG